jgi:hypothetical protein
VAASKSKLPVMVNHEPGLGVISISMGSAFANIGDSNIAMVARYVTPILFIGLIPFL